MFPYIEAKEALKANLTYLSPGLAPYYWIVISLEFAAFNAATQLTGVQWWSTALVVCSIVVVACSFAVAQLCDLTEQTELAQIRVARIAGVATPFLSLALSMSKTRLDPSLFIAALLMTLVQSATFLFLVREMKLQKDKSVNIPQLLVICTSLLFTSHALLGALATREFLTALPAEMHSGYGQDAAEKWTDDMYKNERTAKLLLGDEGGVLELGLSRLLSDVGGKMGRGVHRAYIEAAADQQKNFAILTAFFAALWLVVLARTAHQAGATHRQRLSATFRV